MNQNNDDQPPIQWTPDIEHLLSTWCDHAKCFVWMHSQSHDICAKKTRSFMISTNVLTAFAGLANVIAGGITVNGFQTAWIFGGLSVLVSTLNVLQDKLGYQTSSHIHKKLASDWSRIKAKIEEALSIPYAGRKDCKSFMRYLREEIGNASTDGNSLIPEYIRVACYEKFKDITYYRFSF
jgi:hypothetical protein